MIVHKFKRTPQKWNSLHTTPLRVDEITSIISEIFLLECNINLKNYTLDEVWYWYSDETGTIPWNNTIGQMIIRKDNLFWAIEILKNNKLLGYDLEYKGSFYYYLLMRSDFVRHYTKSETDKLAKILYYSFA